MADARDRQKGKAALKAGAAENALRKMLGLEMKFRSIGAMTVPSPSEDESKPPPKFKRE